MTPDRWEQIKDKVEAGFSDFKNYSEELADGSGGSKEMVEFSGPLGKIKLEFTTKPRLLGEKTSYSRRIGSDVKVEKEYDPDETVSFMKAYKLDANEEWEEINAKAFT